MHTSCSSLQKRVCVTGGIKTGRCCQHSSGQSQSTGPNAQVDVDADGSAHDTAAMDYATYARSALPKLDLTLHRPHATDPLRREDQVDPYHGEN